MKSSGSRNFLAGSVFLAVGILLNIIAGIFFFFIEGDGGGIPGWYSFFSGIAICLMGFAVLGFWFVIPAFQKWGKTKPWLAWTFLGIAILIVITLIYFWNVPIY